MLMKLIIHEFMKFFQFFGRLILNLVYGKDCWKKYKVVDPKFTEKEEGSLGGCIGFAIIFGLLSIDFFDKSARFIWFDRAFFALIVIAIIIGLFRDINAVKNGKKRRD